MNMTFIQTLLARIQSQSPKFFIQLRFLSGALVAIAAFLAALYNMHGLPFSPATNDLILLWSERIGPLMTGIWGTSFTGTIDPALSGYNPTTSNEEKKTLV